LKHEVMGAAFWAPVIAQRRRAGGVNFGLEMAILRLLHSNGYGAPIETVFDFAAWLQRKGSAGRYWENAFQQLFSGLDLQKMRSSVSMVERRMRGNPFQAVRLFLLPVVQRVLAKTENNILLSRSDKTSHHSKGDYRKYCDAFQAALAMLLPENSENPATKVNDESTVAWRRAMILRLIQYTHLGELSEDPGGSCLPDTLAAELFLAAERLQVASRPDKAVPLLAREGTVRRSSRFQQDGIAGIRHASPGEDPSSMLQHQMVNAFEVLVEQVENEGFIAYDRPPPLPEKRCFVFAALGADMAEGRGLSLLRAAWWLACQRAEMILCEQDSRVDFAWLQTTNGLSGRGSFVRSPEKFMRMRPGDSGMRYLAQCEGLGAPFRAGRMKTALSEGRTKPLWPDYLVDFLRDEGLQVIGDRGMQVASMILSVQEATGDSPDGHASAWRDEITGQGGEMPVVLSVNINAEQGRHRLAFGAEEPVLVCDDFEEAAQQAVEIANRLIEEMMKVIHNE